MDSLPTFITYGNGDEPQVDALIVSAESVTRWTAYFQPSPIVDPYFAVGSGQQFATAAMYMGATAEEAVKVAMALDPNTGGDIQTLKL